MLESADTMGKSAFTEAGEGKYTTYLQTLEPGRHLVALIDTTFGGESAIAAHRITLGKTV